MNSLTVKEPRFLVIDGHEFDDQDSNLMSDTPGTFPPFYVFDVDGQDYVSGPLPTINAAERLMALIHRTSAALDLEAS